ncbi:hypothetical protein CPB85DRAFT_433872 [Mucidula mucida]|nr:hypothetical protein CPB85DRAFT_433872 [Mucidula mucida]
MQITMGRDVAGTLVPRHYGVWCAKTGKWGGTVLCSVTEWAGVSWDKVAARKGDATMIKKAIGRTVERLHDRYIHHHQLYRRHALWSISPRLRQAYALEISPSFQSMLKYVMHVMTAMKPGVFLLDMFEPARMSPSTQMYRALRFCDRYSALHPSLDHAAVMVVQHHHFFADEPPLEPGITFGFRSDGKVIFNGKGSEPQTESLPEEFIESLLS